MVTNLDWDEEDVWRFYNHRCAAENYIKQAKQGFFIGDVPTAEFYPNYADLLLKVMAYNLSLGLKAAVEQAARGCRTMATLRRLFLQHPRCAGAPREALGAQALARVPPSGGVPEAANCALWCHVAISDPNL